MAQIKLGILKINKILCFKKTMIMQNNQGWMDKLLIALISIRVISNKTWLIRISIGMKEDKSMPEMEV